MSVSDKRKDKNGVHVGAKVLIRAPEIKDCNEFIELARKSVRFHRGLANPPKQKQKFVEYIDRCSQPDFEGMLICRIEDNRVTGAINLSQIFRAGFQNAYMGYFIGEPFAGKGYMKEALQLMLRHTFKCLKLHRIEANIQPKNIASIALVKRSGFTLEGYSRRYLKIGGKWQDHERWAIISEDWRAR